LAYGAFFDTIQAIIAAKINIPLPVGEGLDPPETHRTTSAVQGRVKTLPYKVFMAMTRKKEVIP